MFCFMQKWNTRSVMVLLGCLLGVFAQQVSAQTVPPGILTKLPDNFYTWTNSAGKASIGYTGAGLGEWQFGSSSGDPLRTEDDNIRLIKAADAYIFFADSKKETKVGTGGRFLLRPDPNSILETQTASFIWETGDTVDNVQVSCKIRLVRDVLKYQYTIHNNSSRDKRVGLRVVEDVQFSPNEILGQPTGTVSQNIDEIPYYLPGGLAVRNATELTGGDVPTEWAIRYPDNPGVDYDYQAYWKARQLLTNSANSDITQPDRLVFANLADVTGYTWMDIYDALLPANAGQAPTVDWGSPMSKDTAVGLYYNDHILGPSADRVISGEIQMNWAEVSTVNQFALAATAPDWVGFRAGDNLSTTDVIENGYFEPSVLNLRAYVSNCALTSDTDVSVSISMGTGLKLDAGQVPNYSVHLAGMAEKLVKQADVDQMSWRIIPTGEASGSIPVRITAMFNPGGGVTSTLYVSVPALMQRQYAGGKVPGTTDWIKHFTGFPFTFTSSDARMALNLGAGVDLAWYDTTAQVYRFAASDGVNLQPGQAYWMRMTSPQTVVMQNASPINQRNNYRLQLVRGWNAISNPYQYGISWGKCNIDYNSNTYTLTKAINQGLIRPELWAWNPLGGQYNPPDNPSPSNDLSMELKPFIGYWVYATDKITLVFTPNTYIPAMNPNTPSARHQVDSSHWRVNLQLNAEGTRDLQTTFGIDAAIKDASSLLNVMKPPTSPGGVTAYFPHPEWGRAAGNFAVDLRAPDATLNWSLEVNCDRTNTLTTISWPDLKEVPAQIALRLKDELTGKIVSMRTTPNYQFNSGAGGIRRLTITAESNYTRLAFTQATAQTRRGVRGTTISYGLSAPAAVTVRVRGVTGRLIRTLQISRASGGISTIQWDGMDQTGRILPAGIYLCELFAETAEGQRARTTVQLPTR